MKYLTPIIVGAILFAIPLTDLLTNCPDMIYNWHTCLHWYGWIGLIGFVGCLLWAIAEGLNLTRHK